MGLVNVFTGLGQGLMEFPFVTELAMEDYILSNKVVIESCFDGRLSIEHDYEKAIKLEDGTKGRVDLFAVYKDSYPVIIELKNEVLEKDHLNQLVKYLRKGKKEGFIPDTLSSDITWGGVLVGTGVSSSLFNDVVNVEGFEIALVQINRFRTSLDQSLVVSSLVFPYNNFGSKVKYYSFNGGSFSMSMLTWACLKDYVKNHKNTTFAELNGLVNIGGVHGSRLLVLEELSKIPFLSKSYRGAYYVKQEQLIVLEDVPFVVLGWWNASEFGVVENIISNLGYKIDKKNMIVVTK